ncbi:hypothetical protein GDO86_018155 [Hymenochirus boettgeri]|uniref:G-protein coupled receptors family 1 profile domain-containing protein n=1 Tax=Hymenochirus boettgeri TaxID=247094 RepID=A0A8T2IEP3_9PIPI|nr:hypothetical protein GDO86_018156 [Hymenochirus boettgeri]KAG8429168.1 hypothetical protein GDO86_018155 [Hymenochirus boettgeri]
MEGSLLFRSFSRESNCSQGEIDLPTDGSLKEKSLNAEPPDYNRQLRIISMTVIFGVALVGNTLVLYKILSGKEKKRKVNILITHLALADLYVSILTLLSQIIWEMLEDQWLLGDGACRVFKVLQVSGLMASSNMIALIALERHHAILYPLSSPIPAHIFAGSAWLLAFLLSVPQAFVFKVYQTEQGHRCQSTFRYLPRWHFQVYIIYSSVTVFFLPFCILCVAYAGILWVIWRKGKVKRTSKTFNGTSPDQGSCGELSRRPLKLIAINSLIPRAKIKTLKMTLVIIILFIVCGLPYFVVEMKVAFASVTGLDQQVMAVLGIFVVTNSAVNPYVYLFFRSNNIFLRKLEKKVCFTCCLRDYRDLSLQRDPFPSFAPTPKKEPSSTSTSEVEASSALPRLIGNWDRGASSCESCM